MYVDGVEADYWLDGINTATTKIWVNIDWQAAQRATLSAAMASSRPRVAMLRRSKR